MLNWRSEECNFEVYPQDYLGHFSVKTFLLTILIQRINLVRILGMRRIIEQKSSSSRWRLWTKTSNRCEIHERQGGVSALFIGVSFSGFHSNRQNINIKVSHQHFLSPLGLRVLSGEGRGGGYRSQHGSTWRNWNLQQHNIASLYNTSLFAKLQFYLIELFTEQAMPQSPAAAIVWFQTAKNKNTKQSNQKTNMNKTAFCGVEFTVCMTFEACTT